MGSVRLSSTYSSCLLLLQRPRRPPSRSSLTRRVPLARPFSSMWWPITRWTLPRPPSVPSGSQEDARCQEVGACCCCWKKGSRSFKLPAKEPKAKKAKKPKAKKAKKPKAAKKPAAKKPKAKKAKKPAAKKAAKPKAAKKPKAKKPAAKKAKK